jgi:hypothetical protein
MRKGVPRCVGYRDRTPAHHPLHLLPPLKRENSIQYLSLFLSFSSFSSSSLSLSLDNLQILQCCDVERVVPTAVEKKPIPYTVYKHTHTHREREGEREGERALEYTHKHSLSHTQVCWVAVSKGTCYLEKVAHWRLLACPTERTKRQRRR